MTPEAWNPIEIESAWLDALAILGEYVPGVDEVAESFHSDRFEASITGDDARLIRLAEEARDVALQGREIAFAFEHFAYAVQDRDAPLARAVIHALREMAAREFRLSTYDQQGRYGMLD